MLGFMSPKTSPKQGQMSHRDLALIQGCRGGDQRKEHYSANSLRAHTLCATSNDEDDWRWDKPHLTHPPADPPHPAPLLIRQVQLKVTTTSPSTGRKPYNYRNLVTVFSTIWIYYLLYCRLLWKMYYFRSWQLCKSYFLKLFDPLLSANGKKIE